MTIEDEERTAEYNLFGPWIDEVTEPARIPPLFRTYPMTFGADTVALKVPRNIARRDAHPAMDLYDRLLLLEPDALTVLTRNGIERPRRRAAPVPRGFTTERIAYGEVAAVDESVNLLDGRLRILSSSGSVVALSFNGAGRAGLATLTATLRERMASTNPRGFGEAGRAIVAAGRGREVDLDALTETDDVGIASAVRALARAHPGVEAWTCHPRERLAPRAGGPMGVPRRLAHLSKPATLQASAMVGDEHAMTFVGRHEQLTRGSLPMYSDRRITVSLASVDRIECTDHPVYPRVVVATVTAGACELAILTPRDTAMHAVLEAAR